jgi:AraC-like DNA-binding protein
MHVGPSVSMHLVGRLVAAAAARGANPAELVAAIGLTPDDLADRDGTAPHTTLLAVWREAAARTGDEAFGLHAAELIRQSPDNVLAYAFQHSSSLRDAIGRASRYIAVAHRATALHLVEDGDAARVRLALHPELQSTRHGPEFALALFCIAGRQYVRSFAVREVSLRHGPPGDDAEYRRIFGSPACFGRQHDEVVFDRALLGTPMRDADPLLCAFLERRLDDLLREGTATAFVERVRRAVARELRGGNPNVDSIARGLHMSARSLQRRLHDSETSFSRVVEDTRRELATAYLAEPKLSVAEVAFLLGFSEVSNFHRAFKRWTGRTPAEARRQQAVRRDGSAMP